MRKKVFLTMGWLLLSCIAVMAQSPDYLASQEAEVYKLHEAEVKAYAKIAVGDQLSELNTKYTIAVDYQTPLSQLIEERETRLSIYNFIYPDDPQARYKAKQAIKKTYQNSLDRTLLRAGANATTPNYSLALKIKDRLSLSQAQIDTIIERAIEINRMLERRPNYATWPHELKTFSSMLSEKQMDDFLVAQNQPKASRRALYMWQVLKDNNLVLGLDSAVTMGRLNYYYTNLEKANSLYAQNDSLKKIALSGVNNSAPLAMQRYWAFRQMSRIKSTYKGTYAW